MLPILAIGKQNFSEIRQNICYYVDKTKFIREWWNGQDDVTLITRPRRFGKTLMLDTVKTFFSPEFAGRQKLFEGLEIWNDEKFQVFQGKIPVIFLSFAEVKYDNYDESVEKIKEIIADLYDYFTQFLDRSLLSEREKKQFDGVSEAMSDVSAHSSLRNLSRYLARQYGQKPIILLDEYDSPLHEAWLEGYWEKLVKFMRVLFNATFKTNQWMQRGLLTGITRIGKESIFSDMNNLEVVGTTSDRYTDCFGFTEEEVFAAMDEYGLKDKEDVKAWYDGFIFGKQKEIYNPWSIIGYLSKRRIAPYWGNTSSNALLGRLMARSSSKVKEEFAELLNGEPIVTKLDEEIVFSQLYTKKGSVWSLLMASGYVKPLEFDLLNKIYKITFTNREVHLIMNEIIYDWFNNESVDGEVFRHALLSDDLISMNKEINVITRSVFSFFDTGGDEPERFYHAFVLGLIVDLKEQYDITSNQESGDGRYDIMMMPKRVLDHGIVIEFKTMDPGNEKDLKKTCNNALKQIRKKEYVAKLQNSKVDPDRIYVYGFAFSGKHALISGGAYEKIDWNALLGKK